MSAPFSGLYIGVLTLMTWVAKQTLHASDLEIAILVAAPSAAYLFTIYWAHLMEGRPKMPWVVWPGLMGLIGAHGVFSVSLGGFVASEIFALCSARAEQKEADSRSGADADED